MGQRGQPDEEIRMMKEKDLEAKQMRAGNEARPRDAHQLRGSYRVRYSDSYILNSFYIGQLIKKTRVM